MSRESPSERLDRLRAVYAQEPAIRASFPLTYTGVTKSMVWTCMMCACSNCRKELSDEQVHGRVWASSPTVHSIEAVGLCQDCRLLCEFVYRLHADGSFTGLDREGQWARWTTRRAVVPSLNLLGAAMLRLSLAAANIALDQIDRLLHALASARKDRRHPTE